MTNNTFILYKNQEKPNESAVITEINNIEQFLINSILGHKITQLMPL